MKKPKALLADDHTLLIQGLQSLLTSHVELLGTAGDGRALVEMAMRLEPDIIILDISMPVLNGIEAARRLRTELPSAKIIFLTQYADALYVDEALRIGVSGYVLKHSAVTELVEAIAAVRRGRTYITPQLKRDATGSGEPRGETQRGCLTSRQREVLQLIAEGCSAKEIASVLGISVKTAEFHKANLTRRLGLHTTAELVKYAVRRGITPE